MKAYEKGEWAKALEYFKQVLGTEPNSPDIQYYIGECFRFLEQYKNAVAAYDAALKIDPAFAPAYQAGPGSASSQPA
jgi:tetratricopeptide (TPR) repeat protein